MIEAKNKLEMENNSQRYFEYFVQLQLHHFVIMYSFVLNDFLFRFL